MGKEAVVLQINGIVIPGAEPQLVLWCSRF